MTRDKVGAWTEPRNLTTNWTLGRIRVEDMTSGRITAGVVTRVTLYDMTRVGSWSKVSGRTRGRTRFAARGMGRHPVRSRYWVVPRTRARTRP